MSGHSATPATRRSAPARRRSGPVAGTAVGVRLGAAALGLALIAGCSASSDVDLPAADGGPVPHWITTGVELARAEREASSPLPTLPDDADGGVTTADPATSLPSKEMVVAALTNGGLTAEQAGCVYDKVSADPQTSAEVTALLTGLQQGGTNPDGTVSGLSPEGTTRLVTTVAPCLDQAALVGLLAAGQGTTPSGNSQLAALINNAKNLDLTKLAGFDPAQILKTIAGNLPPDQVKLLQTLLSSVGNPSQIPANILASIDLSSLDLSTLKPEDTPLLVLALMKGLTDAQRTQLTQLAKIRLEDLNLDIDPDALTPEEVGRLLLLLSPILSSALQQPGSTPPPGADPNQIYIPPGLDLSNINPLIFLNRADAIAEFQRQGVSPAVGACVFDAMARQPASTISAFFSSETQNVAALTLALTVISCLSQNP